jgi:hypothetical protein
MIFSEFFNTMHNVGLYHRKQEYFAMGYINEIFTMNDLIGKRNKTITLSPINLIIVVTHEIEQNVLYRLYKSNM